VRFRPPLPRWKREAIEALAMGPVVKIALLFARPRWPADLALLHARGEQVPTFWRPLPSRAPALIGWVASRQAEALRRKDAVEAAVQSLSRALGERVRPHRALVFDWQADELARGAYSWARPGRCARSAIWRGRWARCTSRARPRTSWGTVHGALETGVRAAREILAG